MALLELKDLMNEDIRQELETILNSHNKFLNKVVDCLKPLSKNRPEVFRRPMTFRPKQLTSIYNNLRKMKVQNNEVLKGIIQMEDLAGVRLTIATKDQFEQAEKIMFAALSEIGTPRKKKIEKNKETNSIETKNKTDDSGYDAIHYILEENNLKCEIQIRTLTQDLWAVFSHYESYKYESSFVTKQELINFSKLMDVADDYAQLIRNRKINEAEELHKHESKIKGKDGLSFETFEKILTDAHNDIPGLKDFEWIKFDVLELCAALKLIHAFEIYSADDLIQVVNEEENKNTIKLSMKKHDLHDLSFFKAFYILCWCHLHSKSALGPKNFGPSISDFVDMMVKVYKVENEFEKLSNE